MLPLELKDNTRKQSHAPVSDFPKCHKDSLPHPDRLIIECVSSSCVLQRENMGLGPGREACVHDGLDSLQGAPGH